MLGVDPEVIEKFGDPVLMKMLSYRGGGDGHGVYKKENGDLTTPLPVRHHLQYVERGWLLVRIVSPLPAKTDRIAAIEARVARLEAATK